MQYVRFFFFAQWVFLRGLVATTIACLALVALPAAAQDGGEQRPAGVAFALNIHAPQEVRQLLEQHLDLLRYQSLPDLGDTELQRLLLGGPQEVRGLVATLGYFAPEIRFTLQPPSAGTPTRHIDLDVTPGPQAHIASVHIVVDGAIAQDPDGAARQRALQEEWQLPVDSAFTQSAWDSAKRHALAQLLARRYAAARLVDSSAEVQADQATVALTLQLDSGPAYRIGPLKIQGNQRYPMALVRDLARLHAGDDYRAAQLVEAQQRITDSAYYDAAYLHLDLDSDPQAATVQVQVKEASLQKLVFGLGASTDSGMRVSVEHIHQQVPGIGWHVDNKLSVDRLSSNVSSDWTSPPDGSAWRWAGSVLVSQQKINDTDVGSQQYRFGRLITQDQLDQSYYLQFAHSDTVVDADLQESLSESLTANYAFTLRHLDSLPFPSSGWALGGEFAAGSTLGTAQEPFGRVLLRWRDYQPLGSDTAPAQQRQRAGRLVFNAQGGVVLVNDVASVPFVQMFLAGGDNSVRGYKVGDIGVTGAGQSNPVPGRYLLSSSLEWQRPIYRDGRMTDWESAVFFDTAAVANDLSQLGFCSGVGLGARWKSPIGPLQIDLAYGLATQQFSLHLGVGFVF